MPLLCVVLHGGVVELEPGSFLMPEKLRTGLVSYCDRWPGEVVFVAPPAEGGESNLGLVDVRADAMPFQIQVSQDLAAAAARLNPDITLLPLDVRSRDVQRAVARSVLTVEHSAASRCRMATVGVSRREQIRIWRGWAGVEARFTRMLRAADGAQFNGWPSFRAYRARTKSPMVFFDTRLRASAIPEETRPRKAGPVRLAFSGRFIPIKGAVDAAQVATRVWEAGLLERFEVFGAGPQEPEMRDSAPPGTVFRGSVPFEGEWVRNVRDGVDLMVLPHKQDDPAGTYLEAAGLGVPVAGYDNRALRELVAREGLGWTAPLGDTDSLAALIIDLANDPEATKYAARAGIRFMRQHDVDAEFERRVEHLVSVLK